MGVVKPIRCRALRARCAKQLLPEQGGIAQAWRKALCAEQVIYPAEFVGEWQVTARLSNVSFPLGQTYINKDVPGVTKSSLIAVLPDVGAGMDDAVTYRARYTRLGEGAIPDRCDLGTQSVAGPACVYRVQHKCIALHVPTRSPVSSDAPCRTYNQRQLLNAFLGYEATQTVEYDRQANKTRFAVVYKTPRRDQREQSSDLRKAELFVNNCRFDARGSEFFSTEAIRQVNQARQSGFVYDYEIVQRWSGVGSQSMQSFVRVGAFLNPEAAGFFKSQGKAIALYDYELAFKKA